LSGGAAMAAAHGAVDGHALASHAAISHPDAMHATHLTGGKLSEGEHTTSKLPSMDHHHLYRREPKYEHQYFLSCIPGPVTQNMAFFDCNTPTKTLSGHRS
jgi:hypothetical protein